MQVSKISTSTSNFRGKFTEFDIIEHEFPRYRTHVLVHRVVYNPFKNETKSEIDAAIDEYVKENQKSTTEIRKDKRWKILDKIKCYVGIVLDENQKNENV